MRPRIAILLLVFLATVSGCACDEKPGPFDQLWRQGYGFNNPNYQRQVDGLPTVGF
jgi:hypothetical protein